MLACLRVANLMLLEQVELHFGPGLNVLTGETGAGKSVLLKSLSLILGGRAQADWVIPGKEGVVEALFQFDPDSALGRAVAAHGLPPDEGELVVRRTLAANGRGRVSVNGQMATVSMLGRMLRGAVDVTGQHEHVGLLDADRHLDLLDEFGELGALRAAVQAAHAEVAGYRASLAAMEEDGAEKARREDYLRFAVSEIDSAAPEAGEFEALEARLTQARHGAQLAEGVARAEASLYTADGAVVESVGRVAQDLTRLAALDVSLLPLATQLEGILVEVEEAARGIRGYQRGLSGGAEDLDALEHRRAQLLRLFQKYGGDESQVLETRAALAEELDELLHEEDRQSDLVAALTAAESSYRKAAGALSRARKKAARRLESAVRAELGALSMTGARLKLSFTPTDAPSPRGDELAEFLLAPSTSAPLRPLRKTASGGELSRLLLAFKQVLAQQTGASTYVFDEVDTGIGGGVAEVLGAKLRAVADHAQVVCVTHLPQVAAFADEHLLVEKQDQGDGPRTTVRRLAMGAERVGEIARMLGGMKITKKTRALAEELLERAG